jgi:hypothetical protein
MGCGEYNLLVPQAEDESCEENRRASIHMLDPTDLPELPCAAGSIEPCQEQLKKGTQDPASNFRCPVYEEVAAPCECDHSVLGDWLEISLIDEYGDPADGAYYVVHLADGSTRDGNLDAAGKARVEGVPSGRYWVEFPVDYDTLHYVED